jgi:hypothetical protein
MSSTESSLVRNVARPFMIPLKIWLAYQVQIFVVQQDAVLRVAGTQEPLPASSDVRTCNGPCTCITHFHYCFIYVFLSFRAFAKARVLIHSSSDSHLLPLAHLSHATRCTISCTLHAMAGCGLSSSKHLISMKWLWYLSALKPPKRAYTSKA